MKICNVNIIFIDMKMSQPCNHVFCSLIFVSVVRTPDAFIFQGIKLKVVYSVHGICRIVTQGGWRHSFHLTILLYRLSTNQIDCSTKSRFILELKD